MVRSMIATVENAMMARVREGLGSSVLEVDSYRGQLDDEAIRLVVNRVPAVYVSFAGHKQPRAHNTAGDRVYLPATFSVFVVTRNVADEKSGRVGTAHQVGAYQLVEAVRRLVGFQDFGLPIKRFTVGAVQLVGHIKVAAQGLTVYGCGFDTAWVDVLADGLPRADHPAFVGLGGVRADAEVDLLRIDAVGAVGQLDAAKHSEVRWVDGVAKLRKD